MNDVILSNIRKYELYISILWIYNIYLYKTMFHFFAYWKCLPQIIKSRILCIKSYYVYLYELFHEIIDINYRNLYYIIITILIHNSLLWYMKIYMKILLSIFNNMIM